MCENCGCKPVGKPVQYKCDCGDDCSCGAPMKRIK